MQNTEFIVEAECNGLSLEKYLKQYKGMSSRTLVKLKHTEGGLTCNGEHIRTIDSVKSGDKIILSFTDKKPLKPSYDVPFEVSYEDNEYIVCNKNGNTPTHPSLAYSTGTLANGVAGYLKNKGYCQTVRVINRLDKDTSGLVLMAKHQYASSLVKDCVDKTYFAIVSGCLQNDGIINSPIKKISEESKKRTVDSDGEFAVTRYSVISSNQAASFLKIKLETGRTHQIRVHFASIGHPLIGDTLYGLPDSDISRQALHCKEISFENKITGGKIIVNSDFPDDFFNVLKKYALSANGEAR